MLIRLVRRVFASMVAATLTAVACPSAGAARGYSPIPLARSYSGSYSVTITNTGHGTFTGCLTLSGSGSASLVLGTGKFPSGTYLVTNRIFVATIQAQGYGQNAGLLFIARAGLELDRGVFEEVYGGSDFLSGDLAFGAKGSC